MKDLRTVALECLLFVLALPALVLGITFGAIFLWGGLSLVVEEMLFPLLQDKDPYTWVLRVGTAEVLAYGVWWWRKNQARLRPVARTARPVRMPPSRQPMPLRQPMPSQTPASRTMRVA